LFEIDLEYSPCRAAGGLESKGTCERAFDDDGDEKEKKTPWAYFIRKGGGGTFGGALRRLLFRAGYEAGRCPPTGGITDLDAGRVQGRT